VAEDMAIFTEDGVTRLRAAADCCLIDDIATGWTEFHGRIEATMIHI
jgi:hypothetical protein